MDHPHWFDQSEAVSHTIRHVVSLPLILFPFALDHWTNGWVMSHYHIENLPCLWTSPPCKRNIEYVVWQIHLRFYSVKTKVTFWWRKYESWKWEIQLQSNWNICLKQKLLSGGGWTWGASDKTSEWTKVRWRMWLKEVWTNPISTPLAIFVNNWLCCRTKKKNSPPIGVV